MKKVVFLKILVPLVSLVFVISLGITILAGVLGAVGGTQSNCTTEVVTSTSTDSSISSGDGSIDSFVKEHKEAYILSWKAGGFLPSASITQTMIENGFNFTCVKRFWTTFTIILTLPQTPCLLPIQMAAMAILHMFLKRLRKHSK